MIMPSYQNQRNKWCTFLCTCSAKYHQTDVGVETLFVRCTSWLCCPSNARYLAVFIKVMYVTGWKQKCDVWRWKQAWNSGVDFDTASELGFLEKREGRLMGFKYSLVFLKRRVCIEILLIAWQVWINFQNWRCWSFRTYLCIQLGKFICTAAVITEVQNPLSCKGICVSTGLADLPVWQVNIGDLLFQHQRQYFNNTSLLSEPKVDFQRWSKPLQG